MRMGNGFVTVKSAGCERIGGLSSVRSAVCTKIWASVRPATSSAGTSAVSWVLLTKDVARLTVLPPAVQTTWLFDR
jgi:hypothetical protein